MNKKVYLAALHKIGFTHKKLFLVFSDNNNFKEIYDNLDYKFLIGIGYTSKQSDSIINEKCKINFKKFNDYLISLNIEIVTFSDSNYIKNLNNIDKKPFLYYLRGNISLPGISFIGSRVISSYGKSVIEKLIPDVGKYFTIISGGAYGCDSYSHKIALKNNIKTICIVGTGIDIDYPASNKKLFDEIVENDGGIISIFPIGEKPNPYNFPIRNEIVACLSEGIVIVEAKEKSGSLITANLGLEQGKELFCIPGDIGKVNSSGCNRLISNGNAKLIMNSEDILNEFNICTDIKNIKSKVIIEDDIEREIYDLLILEPLLIDEIVNKTGYNISTISFKISILEINNLIKKYDSSKYKII